MSETKRPILLNDELQDVTMLHPSNGTLKLSMNDVSECTLTLEDNAETVPFHAWVKVFNQLGFVGIFRRTSRSQTIGSDYNCTLRHGIDILQDGIWNEETTFEGTKAQFIQAILAKQTQLIKGPGDSSPRAPWVLGSCADTSTVKQDINYDNLMDLLKGSMDEGGDYYLTYDQTVWPWQVSVVAKPSAVESEFRLERNMERCRINDDDSELCTRLYLNVNSMQEDEELEEETDITVEQNKSVVRIYNNSTAQALYGIIEKTADIDIRGDLPESDSDPCPEADDWADDFLDRRKAPKLQIEIDGYVLKQITGSNWDESKIGTKSRVSLPDYATYIEERCVTVTYPSLYATPDKVTVSLANVLPEYTKSFNNTATNVRKLNKASRAGARKAESFEQHFEITDQAGNVLRQAGMHLDANGMLVYADDFENMVGAKFNVQADRIGMVVGTYDDGRNYIKAGEIALSINTSTGESTALINADHVNISATSTAHLLSGSIVYDADGNLVLKESSGGGIVVERTESGTTATFGVWDRGTLTGGVMVDEINGQSTTYITGNKINISATNTVQTLAGAMEMDASGNLVIKDGAGFKLRKTVSGSTAEFGVWDKDELTGGMMVQQINGQTGTKLTLNADVIDINGIITSLITEDIQVMNITVTGDGTFTDGVVASYVSATDSQSNFIDIYTEALDVDGNAGVSGNLTVTGAVSGASVSGTSVSAGTLSATGQSSLQNVNASGWVQGSAFYISGDSNPATWKHIEVVTDISVAKYTGWNFATCDSTGAVVNNYYMQAVKDVTPTTKTIYYLGHL